jgi:hypothetical protein
VKPFKHATGRWAVQYSAKNSGTGKRLMKYYETESDAAADIKTLQHEREEHGKASVTAEERQWVLFARKQLGDLDLLPKVIAHWKRTGDEAIRPTSVADAIQAFKNTQSKRVESRTFSDITWRLDKFATRFTGREIHQIHSGEIEQWLEEYPDGWSRKSMFKRLGPLFSYALRHRMLAVSPMTLLVPPETPSKRKSVYTPAQFQEMLRWAQSNSFNTLLPFLGLSGLCFLRTGELVRLYRHEKVLDWEDILWNRRKIHVREEVAKGTKRENDERFPPFSDSFENVMIGFRHTKRTGMVIPLLHHDFSKEWRRMHEALGFKPIKNGMRRSAISYTLAARPELGIVQASKWAGNSEATIKGHYLEILTQEQGEAWFNVPVLF